MDKIKLTINGKKISANKGDSIFEAAKRANIYIPNLCYHPNLSAFGGCRLCIVEVENLRGFPTSCTTPAEDGMNIKTNSKKLNEIRRTVLELIISEHPLDCLTCYKNQNCELQAMAAYFGIDSVSFDRIKKDIPIDFETPLFQRDLNKCILCGRCVRACQELRGVGAIDFINRGDKAIIGTTYSRPLIESECRFCTACVEVCPTAALIDKHTKWLPNNFKKEFIVPCTHNCPANIDIPRYVRLVNEGKYSEALAVIREKVPFPASLGRVCFHPCESSCKRKEITDPIAIKNLKRAAADFGNNELWKVNSSVKPFNGKKVAIIGAGPCGLTAAYYLAKLGYKATVFEALPEPGGMMRYGIPSYRLPKEILEAEIAEITEIGVEILTNKKIENLENLKSDFDAIFIANGAHQGMKMNIEGEDLPSVQDCITLLRDVNLGKKPNLGDKVAIIGGGNSAIDASRTALRLGSKDVRILYRRTRAEMPANPEEILEAEEEGIHFEFLTAPVSISQKGTKLTVKSVKMCLGEPDSSGRRKPIPVEGSEYLEEYDSVILAIGQNPEIPLNWGLELQKNNTIKANLKTLETSTTGIFAGGDVVLGPSSVIEAIAHGRIAASQIDLFLGGDGVIDEVLVEKDSPSCLIGRIDNFGKLTRVELKAMDFNSRKTNFSEILKGYDDQTSKYEGSRCLKCDLRLNIQPNPLPPNDEKSYLNEEG